VTTTHWSVGFIAVQVLGRDIDPTSSIDLLHQFLSVTDLLCIKAWKFLRKCFTFYATLKPGRIQKARLGGEGWVDEGGDAEARSEVRDDDVRDQSLRGTEPRRRIRRGGGE